MTPDELKSLITEGNAQRLLNAVSRVTESERPKLAKLSVTLMNQMSKAEGDWERNHAECCAHLAVIGLGSWEQVRRLRRDDTHLWSNDINLYDWVFDFLKARRPEWIERWVSHQLANDFNPQWGLVRKLVREGICPKPTDDSYIIRMIYGHWKEKHSDEQWQLVDSLREDAELLQDEIWKLFEVEPPGKSVLLYSHDLEGRPESWSKALKTLSASGEIDHGRLLTESLEALRRGRRAAGATWFFRFHEYLEPSLDERAERQSLYLDLLSNAVPAVVTFALDALGLLAKEKRLDAEACLHAVPRVFEVAPKGPPVTAIKLIGRLVKQQPDLTETAAVAVCHALGHEAPDVQKAAITWLESLKLGPNAAVAGEIDNRTKSVAASLRKRVEELRQCVQPSGSMSVAFVRMLPASEPTLPASATTGIPAPVLSSPVVPNELAPKEIALRDEIASLTKTQRSAAGIDAGLRVLDRVGELIAVPIDPLKLMHLLPENELTPIASLDELIEELSSAIESPIDADQFERLLDGLSRLCDQRPPDFATRTAPLLKRATKLSDGFSAELQYDLGLRGLSFFLVAAWCQPDSTVRIKTMENLRQIGFEFLVDRIRELFRRIGVGLAAPLLAAPTHCGGWLSSVAFVNRLLLWQQAGLETYPLDMIQALLRLAPDDRNEAAIAAHHVKSQIGDVVRFALSGNLDEVAANVEAHSALWIAALRGRDPSLRLPNHKPTVDGPDVWTPTMREWHAIRRPESLPAKSNWPLKIKTSVKPACVAEAFHRDLPTLKLNYELRQDEVWVAGEMDRLQRSMPWADLDFVEKSLRWSEMIWGPGSAAAVLRVWPINPDPMFVTGIVSILCVLDAPASTLRRTAEFLEPLFAPQTRFSEMAQLLVAVSLLAKDSGLKGYAVDALIALIEDGRCIGDELGGVFQRLLISDAVKCNRLAEQLGEVARVSLLHKHVCSRIVQTMFSDAAALPNGILPNDVHHLLAPLNEWLVELDEPLHESTRGVLASVTGSSKSAKLAKSLLARMSPADPVQWRQIALASLRGRLPRARLCQS